MSRILGVDYGRRRIGLAVSDELGLTAQGLPTLEVTGRAHAVASVAEVAVARGVVEILVGLPLNMDGTRGELARASESFAADLTELQAADLIDSVLGSGTMEAYSLSVSGSGTGFSST